MQSYNCIVASPKVDKESGLVNVTARTVNNRIWNPSASEAISMRSKLNKKYHNYNYRTVFVVDCKSWSEKDGCCPDLSGMIVVRYTGSRFSPIRRTSTNTKAHNCSTTSDTNTITNTEAQNYSATVNVEELAPKSLSNNLRLGFLLFQDLTPLVLWDILLKAVIFPCIEDIFLIFCWGNLCILLFVNLFFSLFG